VHAPLLRAATALGVNDVAGVRVMFILALLLLCLGAGLLVRARRVSRWREWLENNVLRLIPGYEYIRMRLAEQLVEGSEATNLAVLVRVDEGWTPGMLTERADDGRCVVFIPDVPQGNSGSLQIVHADQLKFLHVPYGKLNDSVRNYGKGLLALEAGSNA
jgi:hypothetical protein